MANILEVATNDVSVQKNIVCKICGKKKEIENFQNNKSWTKNNNKDTWCKDCVSKISTKNDIRKYFWENRREWSEKIWKDATTKAKKSLSDNILYENMDVERKEKTLEKLTSQTVIQIMNGSSYYKFVKDGKPETQMSFEEAFEKGLIKEEQDPNTKVYSKEFNGYFKPNELEYLENYYTKLEEDFSFDTENLRDYARKLCKASLQADRAQDDYMSGRCDYSVVKDALGLFDMLSKSANFAACKRKPGDSGGMNSYSELTYKLETTGHPCTRKIEWPEDDVDKTINEFKYIVEAIGLDTI